MSDVDLGAGKTCFLAGPIGSRLDPRGTEGRAKYEEALQMWEEVFEPACAQFGLSPIRADRIADPGDIPEQIFLHLRDSDLVIADVTGGNANVMYELGLRHTRDRLTIHMGEHGRLPFDINTIRTIQFRRSEGGLIEARDNLIAAIRTALLGNTNLVTATRLWNELAVADTASVTAAVQQSLTDDPDDLDSLDEPGFMDLLADGESALTEVTEVLGRASAAMAETGTLSEAAGERTAQSDARGGGFGGRLLVARQLASDLRAPTEVLEISAGEFLERVQRMDAMMQYMFSRWQQDSSDVEDSREFAEGMLSLIDAAEDSESGINQMIQGTRTLRGIARDFNPVAKSIVVSLNRMLQGTAIIVAWREPLRTIFQ